MPWYAGMKAWGGIWFKRILASPLWLNKWSLMTVKICWAVPKKKKWANFENFVSQQTITGLESNFLKFGLLMTVFKRIKIEKLK